MICGSYMTSYTGKITQLQTTADIVSSFSSVLTWRKSWRESGRSLWKKFTLCIRRLIHFHWSSRHSCLGNCLVWKINMREKTFTLQGWTQMVIFRLFVLNTCKCLPSNCLVPVPEFEISTWALIDHFIVVCSMTWPLNDSKAAADLVLIRTSLLLLCKSSS